MAQMASHHLFTSAARKKEEKGGEKKIKRQKESPSCFFFNILIEAQKSQFKEKPPKIKGGKGFFL